MDRQKELDELFAVAIKQPKLPPGAGPFECYCSVPPRRAHRASLLALLFFSVRRSAGLPPSCLFALGQFHGAGVDPKTVVCEHFRHGKCTKGFKCKYSHDLSIERKGPKASIYEDT
jgi:hypothetical protein